MSDEDDCRGGAEFRRWRHEREIELDDQVYGDNARNVVPPVVEPCRPPEPLTTPAELGGQFAAAARRAGCEDAYDNAIEARYGRGW